MKKFIVIAVSAFVAAPALAADVAVLRPVPGTEYYGYYKGPPRPLAVSWTGCYLGGHVGGAIANYDETNGSFVVPVTIPPGFGPVPPPSSVGFGLDSVHLSSGSGVIGGQAGCNLDLGSKRLIGVEGDAAWTRITNGKLFTGTTTLSGTPVTNNRVTTTPGIIISNAGTPSPREPISSPLRRAGSATNLGITIKASSIAKSASPGWPIRMPSAALFRRWRAMT